MKIVQYMFVAMAGLALSACAASRDADDGALKSAEAQGSPKQNKFEIFFDPDLAEISETAAKILHEAADSAKQSNSTDITLSVHSVAAGWDANSQALSERRAEAVKAELVRDGVPAAEITSVDIAHAQLIPTDDGVREPQNRRTEITLH